MGCRPCQRGSSYTRAVPASQNQRIGLFGGTFDPPHRGHLAAATAVREALDLDEVLMVVANDPWQKSSERQVSPAAVRVAMTRALVEGQAGLVVDDREVRRGGPTYTADTLDELVAERPGAEVFLVVGQDTAATIEATWHRADHVLSMATLVVITRAGAPLHTEASPSGSMYVEMNPVDVSSSQIRDAVGRGESIDAWTTPEVARIIDAHGLYRTHQ